MRCRYHGPRFLAVVGLLWKRWRWRWCCGVLHEYLGSWLCPGFHLQPRAPNEGPCVWWWTCVHFRQRRNGLVFRVEIEVMGLRAGVAGRDSIDDHVRRHGKVVESAQLQLDCGIDSLKKPGGGHPPLGRRGPSADFTSGSTLSRYMVGSSESNTVNATGRLSPRPSRYSSRHR